MFFGLLVQSPRKTHVLTLEEELQSRGIPTIPLDAVRRYQARVLAGDSQLGSGWVKAYEFSDPELSPPPSDIQRKAAQADEIPNAEVYAERFKEDPFLFVSRKRLFGNPEVCCIGYWDAPDFKP